MGLRCLLLHPSSAMRLADGYDTRTSSTKAVYALRHLCLQVKDE
jgi:hypothetical protein